MARKSLKYKNFADLKDGRAVSFDKDVRGNISCQNVSVCTFDNPIGKVAYGIWPSGLDTTGQYYQNNTKNKERVKKPQTKTCFIICDRKLKDIKTLYVVQTVNCDSKDLWQDCAYYSNLDIAKQDVCQFRFEYRNIRDFRLVKRSWHISPIDGMQDGKCWEEIVY